MGIRSITEDFRRMGLSNKGAENSLANMLGETSESDIDSDSDGDFDGDAMSIIEAYKRRRALRGKKKISAKRYRRSASGKAAARKSAKARRRPGAKRVAAKRRKKLAKMGGAKKGFARVLPGLRASDESMTMRQALIENLKSLEEAVERDPVSRFNEYVEAFNHIADLSEVLTLRCHEAGEEEMAEDMVLIALMAEAVLEDMEELNGALSSEIDEDLEEVLASAMETVSEALEDFSALEEDIDEDEDDEDDEIDEDEDEDDDDDEDEEDDLTERARRIAEAVKKKKKGGGEFTDADTGAKYSKKDLDAFEKSLVYGRKGGKWRKQRRKDISDPKGLAGYIARYGSFKR